eukprot:COSAG01_NODE_6407_length_3683_cov_2.022321_3_plen_81_part_00
MVVAKTVGDARVRGAKVTDAASGARVVAEQGVSEAPRLVDAPVRMPLPRADAPSGPGGGIYSMQTLLRSKSFSARTPPKL